MGKGPQWEACTATKNKTEQRNFPREQHGTLSLVLRMASSVSLWQSKPRRASGPEPGLGKSGCCDRVGGWLGAPAGLRASSGPGCASAGQERGGQRGA